MKFFSSTKIYRVPKLQGRHWRHWENINSPGIWEASTANISKVGINTSSNIMRAIINSNRTERKTYLNSCSLNSKLINPMEDGILNIQMVLCYIIVNLVCAFTDTD